MLWHLSKPSFKDSTDLRWTLQEANSPVISLYHFFQKKHHEKFPLQHFLFITGGSVWWEKKFDELCSPWYHKIQLFQKSASTIKRAWIRSKVFFRAPNFCCLFLGEWDQRQRIWYPKWVFKSKHPPQTLCKKLLSRHVSIPTALRNSDIWILSQPFIS